MRKYSKCKNERTRRKSGGPNQLGQVTTVGYRLPKDVMRSEFFWLVKDVTSSGENILIGITVAIAIGISVAILAKFLPQFACCQKT